MGLRETPPLARLMCRPWAKQDSETRTVLRKYILYTQLLRNDPTFSFRLTIASLSTERFAIACFRYLRRTAPQKDAAQRTRDKNRGVSGAQLVSSPDPTYERGSGDIWLIPRASLFSGEKFRLRQSHCMKTQSSATPEVFGYFSMMTQHFFGA